jgi:cell wall-associated NlpC family hydrolase
MAVPFSQNQKLFASALSKATGLDPNTVAAWMVAEEPAGAQSGYAGTQDWLNVGITDSGPMGANNPAWKDPVQAAQTTANWMKGTPLPGFGTAAPGIQSILKTAGQTPAQQLAAIAGSGWASSGYGGASKLQSLLSQVEGTPLPNVTLPGATPAKVPTVSTPAAPVQVVPTTGPNIFSTLAGLETTRQSILANSGRTQTPASSAVEQGWTALSNLYNSQQSLTTAQQNAAHLAASQKNGQAIVNNAVNAGVPAGGGSLSKAVSIALRAVQVENQYHSYTYSQAQGERTNFGRGPIAGKSITFDCSGFVDAVYRAAGLPDPSGNTGFTGTVESPTNAGQLLDPSHLKKVSADQARPGDIVLFPDHVTIYAGNGNVVSMGQTGDPQLVPISVEASYNNRGLTGYYHIIGAT